MESPTTIASLTFLCIMSFVIWYYNSTEKQYNTFLATKLKHRTREEIENKSTRRLKIEDGLKEIGEPMTYDKLSQISAFIMVVPAFVFFFLGAPLVGILFIPFGYKFPEIYISRKKEQKIDMFQAGLADALGQLLAVIQAGQTQTQGFKILADLPYPIGNEFARVYNDIATGADLELALNGMCERIPLKDVKLMTIGCLIAQAATPAVAIDTLKNIISTIQKRESQQKSIKSTVMSGQMTAIILALLPIIVFVGIQTMMPSFMGAFVESSMGKILLLLAAFLDAIGYYFARRITSAKRMIDY